MCGLLQLLISLGPLRREAGTSILSFLIRLVEPSLLRSSSGYVSTVLLPALMPRAAGLMRLLLAGVTGALPDWRSKEIAELIYSMLTVGHVCHVIDDCHMTTRLRLMAVATNCRRCDSKPMSGSLALSICFRTCQHLGPIARRLAKPWQQQPQGRQIRHRQSMQPQ